MFVIQCIFIKNFFCIFVFELVELVIGLVISGGVIEFLLYNNEQL